MPKYWGGNYFAQKHKSTKAKNGEKEERERERKTERW